MWSISTVGRIYPTFWGVTTDFTPARCWVMPRYKLFTVISKNVSRRHSCDYCRPRHAEGSPCTAMNVTSPVCINMTGQANYCYSTHNSLSLSLSHLKYEIPRPRKYWTFVMSWHKDQWRNDLVVICMKTCNLGIYLNFKNLSETWQVNTTDE